MKSRRSAARTPKPRRGQRRVTRHWTQWAFFLVCVFVALGMVVPAAWARPQSVPARQTVPMTPPPTWTPNRPTRPTTEPTRPRPPTAEPITPSSTGEANNPPQAKPWLGVSAKPLVAQPGTSVAILVEVQNLGDGSLENATIVLPLHPSLTFQGVQASLGQAQLGPDGITWTPGSLGGHAGGTLQLAVVIVPDALPGTNVALRATLTWPGGQVQSNEWPLTLPAALLPEAGG
jgi:hypothetical protein